MTEQEWQSCDEPARMLKRARFRSYRRKSRLFAVACCRCTWDLLMDDRSRVAIEAAERHADGGATDEELRRAAEAAEQAHRQMFDAVGKVGSCIEWAAAFAADPNPCHGAKNVIWMAATPRALEVRSARPNDFDEIRLVPCTVTKEGGPKDGGPEKTKVTTLAEAVPTGASPHVQAVLLRDLFGPLPFRSLSIDPAWLAWNEGTVRRLAAAAYDDRLLPSGHLEPTRLAVLADALEDAGADAELVEHLRGPGPHWRGCWAIDILTGRG